MANLFDSTLMKRFFLYMVGIVVMPMGVVLTINSHMGAGGYDALNFALGDCLGWQVSSAIYLTAGIAVVITAAIRRGMPRISTFLTSFFLGISTDIWKKVFQGIKGNSLLVSVLLLIVGMIFVAIGVAGYMHSKFPTNPTDDMVVALKERGVPIFAAKMGMDIFCVVLAWLLGGEIGLGTILVTFGLGPLIDWVYAWIARYGWKLERDFHVGGSTSE